MAQSNGLKREGRCIAAALLPSLKWESEFCADTPHCGLLGTIWLPCCTDHGSIFYDFIIGRSSLFWRAPISLVTVKV